MRFIKEKDYKALSKRAGSIIASQVILNPNCVLGLATGSSPIGTYEYLIELYKNGLLDFENVKTVNLDEYAGLKHTDPQSYFQFMKVNLFDKINIKSTRVPNGNTSNLEDECEIFEDYIAKLGGVDLQLLGLGHNGHIGFNEPADSFSVKTHIVDLSESTINANERFFNNKDEVPRQAITMGIGTIMKARKILLIVNGKAKADIVKQAFLGAVTPNVPASILQLHPDVTIVGDEEAFSKL